MSASICPACAKVLSHPNDGHVCAVHVPKGLDPGIRATVALLIADGFRTTDSGDGRSKPPPGRMLDFPHVVMRVSRSGLVREAHRLARLLAQAGLAICPQDGKGERPAIEAAYDVGAGVATIFLSGVDDNTLRRAATRRAEG